MGDGGSEIERQVGLRVGVDVPIDAWAFLADGVFADVLLDRLGTPSLSNGAIGDHPDVPDLRSTNSDLRGANARRLQPPKWARNIAASPALSSRFSAMPIMAS